MKTLWTCGKRALTSVRASREARWIETNNAAVAASGAAFAPSREARGFET